MKTQFDKFCSQALDYRTRMEALLADSETKRKMLEDHNKLPSEENQTIVNELRAQLDKEAARRHALEVLLHDLRSTDDGQLKRANKELQTVAEQLREALTHEKFRSDFYERELERVRRESLDSARMGSGHAAVQGVSAAANATSPSEAFPGQLEAQVDAILARAAVSTRKKHSDWILCTRAPSVPFVASTSVMSSAECGVRELQPQSAAFPSSSNAPPASSTSLPTTSTATSHEMERHNTIDALARAVEATATRPPWSP